MAVVLAQVWARREPRSKPCHLRVRILYSYMVSILKGSGGAWSRPSHLRPNACRLLRQHLPVVLHSSIRKELCRVFVNYKHSLWQMIFYAEAIEKMPQLNDRI